MKYISPFVLMWLQFIIGTVGVILNQFRDAISAYYEEKRKMSAAIKDGVAIVSTGDTQIITKESLPTDVKP